MTAVCPVTGLPGIAGRSLPGTELVRRYEGYFGLRLPDEIAGRYFRGNFVEYASAESGLRWYDPPVVAGAEFYELLGRAFPWYYGAGWDKRLALEVLESRGVRSVAEIGCGRGWFVGEVQRRGTPVFGVELNEAAVREARLAGLPVFRVDEEIPAGQGAPEAVCLFQVVEHLTDPVGFLQDVIGRHAPRWILLSAPCHEALLGRLSDPLSWPPHHLTSWSERGMRHLAERIGCVVVQVRHDRLAWEEFRAFMAREQAVGGAPASGLAGLSRAGWHWQRLRGRRWARSRHSVFALLRRAG